MEYKKKSHFTMINGDKEIDLLIGQIYQIKYFNNDVTGRLVYVDDGEEPFSTYGMPSLTLDISEKYNSNVVDIILKNITDIKIGDKIRC